MSTIQDTREYMLQYDIKPSVQRMAIMEYLMKNRVHPTADEIYGALYPTMRLFMEQGAIKALVIDEKNVRFDVDTSDHAHFMCLGCGCVYDIPIENREAIVLDGVGELLITETHLYYKGYCKKCAEEKGKII